jgi:hypothetical protein
MSALAPSAKYPSAKWDTVGKTYTGTIAVSPEDRQARKFGTTELATWPDGAPVMQTRIVLDLDEPSAEGSRVAIYAQSRMAKAITKAIVDAEAADIEVGGRLTVVYRGADPDSKNPANPAKLYDAVYTAPAGDDWDPADL